MKLNKSLLIVLILLGVRSPLKSLVTIDYSEVHYTNVITQLTNIGFENVEAVIVRHPFWHLKGKLDTGYGVYYWDSSKYLRALKSPSAGTISELKELALILHKKKIKVYSRLDPYIQIKDFYTGWWNRNDFTINSLQYSKYNLISLSGSGKLGPLFRAMKSLPIDKWIIHIDNVPPELQVQYARISKKGLGGKLILYSSFTNKIAGYPMIQALDYWNLRQGAFLTPIARLSILSNFKPGRQTHIIDSDSLTINNVSTTIYMLSQGLRVVVPASFSRNKGVAKMIKAIQSDNRFKIKLLSEETMMLYSTSQIISFHLGNKMSMIKIPSLITNKGTFNSVVGNSVLYSENNFNYFLLFPDSVYLWDIH